MHVICGKATDYQLLNPFLVIYISTGKIMQPVDIQGVCLLFCTFAAMKKCITTFILIVMAVCIGQFSYAARTQRETFIGTSSVHFRQSVFSAGKGTTFPVPDSYRCPARVLSLFPVTPSIIPGEFELPVPATSFYIQDMTARGTSAVPENRFQHLFPFHYFW